MSEYRTYVIQIVHKDVEYYWTQQWLLSYAAHTLWPESNLPLKAGSAVRSDQAAQHFIESGHENQHRWATVLCVWAASFMACLFSWWPEVFPYIQLELSLIWHMSFVSCHPSRYQGEEPCSSFPVILYKNWKAAINKTTSLSLSSQGTFYSLTSFFHVFHARRI